MKWISAKPLEGFSSLHEGSLWHFRGRRIGRFSSVISFNIETALPRELASTMTMHTRPVDQSSRDPRAVFNIDQLTHWELDLTPFQTFEDYLKKLKYKHRANYFRTEEGFANYGCTLTVFEGDWSEYAHQAYELYQNVASKYMQIYDLEFFRSIAKLPTYKLICAWHGERLIGSLVMVNEPSTTHSMGCGLDYTYSKKSYTYSRLHYEFIRLAIASGKYKRAGVGVTADQAKKTLGFSPRPALVEICVNGRILRRILRFANLFIKISLNEEHNVSVRMRWPKRFLAKKTID